MSSVRLNSRVIEFCASFSCHLMNKTLQSHPHIPEQPGKQSCFFSCRRLAVAAALLCSVCVTTGLLGSPRRCPGRLSCTSWTWQGTGKPETSRWSSSPASAVSPSLHLVEHVLMGRSREPGLEALILGAGVMEPVAVTRSGLPAPGVLSGYCGCSWKRGSWLAVR